MFILSRGARRIFCGAVMLFATGSASTPAHAYRPSVGAGVGWSAPLDERVNDIYGGAPRLELDLAFPIATRFSAEIGASALRKKSDLTAPSFLDSAEGTLTLVPVRAGVTWTPRSAGPWLRGAAIGQWSREEVSYELLGDEESVEHSRFDPGASIAGGWIFDAGSYALRAGIEAAWIAGDRQVLRSEGDAPKIEDASAGSFVALTVEMRF